MVEYIPLKRCSSCGVRSTQSLCPACKKTLIERQAKKKKATPVIVTTSNDRDFYNSKFWTDLSAYQRHIVPYCQGRLESGKICYSTKNLQADHIIPRAQGGKDDRSNLQTLCSDCHIEKTNRENGLFGQRGDIIAVCGPPGSGKSHYIAQHWQRGDLLIDLDRLIPAITLDTYTNEPKHVLKMAWALRDAAIKYASRSSSYARLWITETAPSKLRRDQLRSSLNARVLLMRCPKAICIQRANNQPQGRKRGDWTMIIDDWFDRYEPSQDDEIIDTHSS